MLRRIMLAIAVLAVTSVAAAQSQPADVDSIAAKFGPLEPIGVVGFTAADGIDDRDKWMATGLEEMLCRRLRFTPGLTAMPTVRVYQARREIGDSDEGVPKWKKTLTLLGARWHVIGVVSGTPEACTLQLTCTRFDGDNEKAESETIGPDRIYTVLDRATEWLLARFGVDRLEAADHAIVFAPPASTSSGLEYYAKAVLAARAENPRDTVYYLEKAVVADPTQSYVHEMLAQVEARLSANARATATARLRHVQEHAREIGDKRLDIDIEISQASILANLRSFEPALQRLTRARDAAVEMRDAYRCLSALNGLADVYVRRESYPDPSLDNEARTAFQDEQLKAAASALEQVLGLLQQLGDVVAETPIANKLALIYDRLGDKDKALEMHKRTLAAAQRTGSRGSEATAWMFLGQWYREQERYDEALDAINKCMALADDAARPKVQIALADIYRTRGDQEAALTEYQSAYDTLENADPHSNTGALEDQLLCLDRIAELQKQLGRRADALKALQGAIDIAEVLELPIERALRDKLATWKAE